MPKLLAAMLWVLLPVQDTAPEACEWTFLQPSYGASKPEKGVLLTPFEKEDACVGIISTQEAWTQFWKTYAKEGLKDDAPVPPVDFKAGFILFARPRRHGRCRRYTISTPSIRDGVTTAAVTLERTDCGDGHKRDHSAWRVCVVKREGIKSLGVRLGKEVVEASVPPGR